MGRKREIRNKALEKRSDLSQELRENYSRRITEQVLAHPMFQSADCIFVYVSFREEVDTSMLLNAAWKTGKTVAVPRVLDKHSMEFYRISSREDLVHGYQGISEPKNGMKKAEIPCKKQAVMLLPGAAFDRKGNRIGYGKGFYDRYLQENPCFYKIGLAFSVQCTEEIPAEKTDVCVDMVITEQGEYREECSYADRIAEGPDDTVKCHQYKAQRLL